MSDVVWAINPARDRWSDLLFRMRRFANDLFADRPGALRLNLPEVTDGERIDPEVRREVYLVFKEALHNAARHAAAGLVEVALERTDGMVSLLVRDDGRGFSEGGRATGTDWPA